MKKLAIPIALMLAFIATPAQAHIPVPKSYCLDWESDFYTG